MSQSPNEQAFRRMLEEHRILPDWAPPEPPSAFAKWSAEVRAAWMKARGIEPRG